MPQLPTDAVREVIEALIEKIETLQETVDRIESRLLTPQEKEEREFDRAQRITLADVRQWAQGDVVDLITCSHYHPSTEAVISSFQFKFDRLGAPIEGPDSGFEDGKLVQRRKEYVPVEGVSRFPPDQDWTPESFLAAADECSTRGYEGTVRAFEARGRTS